VIAMRVCDNDVRDRLAPHRIEERLDMCIVKRAGIDDGNTTSSDNVAHCSLEGERSWIVAEQTTHARINLLDLAGRKVEALVERDIVTHRTTGGIEARRCTPYSAFAPENFTTLAHFSV